MRTINKRLLKKYPLKSHTQIRYLESLGILKQLSKRFLLDNIREFGYYINYYFQIFYICRNIIPQDRWKK